MAHQRLAFAELTCIVGQQNLQVFANLHLVQNIASTDQGIIQKKSASGSWMLPL